MAPAPSPSILVALMEGRLVLVRVALVGGWGRLVLVRVVLVGGGKVARVPGGRVEGGTGTGATGGGGEGTSREALLGRWWISQ